MEVVTASPGSGGVGGVGGVVPPYQRRDVEEWSHLDRLTGMLEHARVETDHWAANTHNTHHKYGKVVDSRDRCTSDGSQHQRQRRQLEVFQAHVPGGSLQVIRTQTVATSSSRWSSSTSTSSSAAAATAAVPPTSHDFENLQLALNPLDLSSQKTRASVGRSGSIGGRRPPSRPRSIVGRIGAETDDDGVYVHDVEVRPSILERQSGDGSVASDLYDVETPNGSDELEQKLNGNSSKSPSPVDFHKIVFDRSEHRNSVLEQIENWKRISADRRSQLSNLSNKPSSFTSKPSSTLGDSRGSVKLKPDLETGRRLNTVLRGNSVDLEALDRILKSISSTSADLKNEQPEKDVSLQEDKTANSKRCSFITVESLQEVRGRLRRLSSPTDDYYSSKPADLPREEEPDDGIVEEDCVMKKEDSAMPASNSGVSRVRSYVYGMEAMLHNKKPIIGTGSLESRTSNKANGGSVNRSEDWYNRRKSYGFEQVHNQQIEQNSIMSLRGKGKIESSTDSGICRSTEIVVVPSVVKSQNYAADSKPELSVSEDSSSKYKVTATSYSKTGNSTVINLGGDSNRSHSGVLNSVVVTSDNKQDSNELFSVWNRRAIFNNIEENHADKQLKNDTEQITITIPIMSEDTPTNGRRLYHRQMSDGTSVSVESSWAGSKNGDSPDKRHSIAVDESKYVSRTNDTKYQFIQPLRRTSLAERNDDPCSLVDADEETNSNQGKKQKKVEFCKTEVHFAAESGRVNIVETDEKPPPTQNFRRRRRNSNVSNNHIPEDFNKTGLPLIHFGDTSYEKKLFGVSDQENGVEAPQIETDPYNRELKPYSNGTSTQESVVCNNMVTVSSVSITKDFEPEPKEVQKENEVESQPRGILKNKMIKPRPYLLGDDNNDILSRETSNDEQEGTIWGVRLRPVHKQEESAPIWRSTVTVQNTAYNIPITRDTQITRDPPITRDLPTIKDTFPVRDIPGRDIPAKDLPGKDTSRVESPEKRDLEDLENPKPEFQKLLNSLRPARKSEPCVTVSSEEVERRSSPIIDLRRSSWSVADRVKQVEDMRYCENKGYSTRVNFGGGEATVVENVDLLKTSDRHTTWPRQEEAHSKDEKRQSSVLNKGLVVRIGREDSNHTVCSKTTTNHNSHSTTTTTKITIDMSPSPTNVDKFPMFSSIKLPRASLHSLKSTPLILNTFNKTEPAKIHTRPENVRTDPRTESLRIGKSRTEHSRTVLSRTERSRTEHSLVDLPRAELSKDPSRSDLSRLEMSRSDHSRVEHSRLESSRSENLRIESSRVEASESHRGENPTSRERDKEVRPAATLAALRRLYDEAAEHSDDSQRADEEVRSYMSGGGDDSDIRDTEDDVSSVVSGSWSKMRAFRNIKQHLQQQNAHSDTTRQKEHEMFKNIINRHTYAKKDFPSVKPVFHSSVQKKISDPFISSRYEKHSTTEGKITSLRSSNPERKLSDSSLTGSPQTNRKHAISNKKIYEPIRTQYTNGHLSSPSLVGSSSVQKSPRSYQSRRTESTMPQSVSQSKGEEKKYVLDKEERPSAFSRVTKGSPVSSRKPASRKNNLSSSYSSSQLAKRNEKKSDQSSHFYSEIQSPKLNVKKLADKREQKWKENKPDLLQHYSDTREYINLSSVIQQESKDAASINAEVMKKDSRSNSPPEDRAESPIYENIDEVISGLSAMEKESSILQELTKAADQILQAVNGYTDEDSARISTDDEEEGRKHRLKNFRKTGETLSTISETKSWKHQSTKEDKHEISRLKNSRNKVRPTSSTSSIESVTREVQKPIPPVRQNRATKLHEEKMKKKISGSNSELSKATRARRLQRANSREALLQSHGSSSEDMSNSVEVIRKPRLVRRVKGQQSSTSTTEEIVHSKKSSVVQQTNVARRRECDTRRSVDRVPVVGLQEIRHKTAVSTIRSTAEKAACREKALKAREDLRKRTSARREPSSSKGGSMAMMSHHGGAGGSSGRTTSSRELSAVRTSSGVYVPAYRCNSLVAISRSNSECPCLCS